MHNPNVKILLVLLALVVAVAGAGLFISRQNAPADGGETTGEIKAFLRIQVGDQVWDPIAIGEGGEYVIEQPDGKQNVVRTSATGAVMHFSTCDNQSCVEQGEVTLENRDSRVLSNMIICLPNEVILEVLTPEEAAK